MPKLHPVTGLAACGTAGGRISFGDKTGEQFVLCDGGCSFWLNPDEIAYLGPESGSWETGGRTLPQAVHIHTKARRLLEDNVPPALAREANFLAAGGNRWQAAIAGPIGASFGLCGEHPGGSVSRAMTDGRGACSVDGTIALIDSYQGSNNGFRLCKPNGLLTERIANGSDPYHLTVIDKDRAIWTAPPGTYGITPLPLWLKGSLRACWVELGGVPYVVHWLEGVGLVARRADSNRGTILSREDKEFHYDAIAWEGGIRIAWALWDGEAPGSLVVTQWDTVSNIIDLVPDVPPIVQPTFAFNHKVMVVLIKDPLNETAAPMEVLVNQNAQRGTRPVFVAEDTLLSTWNGPLQGIYTEAKGDALAKVQKTALSLKTRVMVVHDSRDPWTLPPGMRVCDIPVIEHYIYPGETMEQAVARWRRDGLAMKAAWPHDRGVVPMYYCMGGRPPDEVWPVGTVLQTQSYLSALVNETGARVLVPFSYLRDNGIKAHPELQQSLANLLAASTVIELTPVPKPPDPPDPPKPPTPFPPALPGKVLMQPFKAALRLGAHFFTRVDPTPGLAPWPDWCVVKADRTDQNDPDCEWEITMPEGPGNTHLRAVHVKTGRTMTLDFTEFGGNVCQGFYGSPDSAGWFGYQQLSGWTLGPNGPEILTVDYSIVGTKAAAPCLTVVRL